MGNNISQSTNTNRKQSVTSIKDTSYTEKEFMELLHSLKGDNGPGDNYVADFADKNKRLLKLNSKEISGIYSDGLRFVNTKTKSGRLECVLVANTLYVVQLNTKTTKNFGYKLKLSPKNSKTLENHW